MWEGEEMEVLANDEKQESVWSMKFVRTESSSGGGGERHYNREEWK